MDVQSKGNGASVYDSSHSSSNTEDALEKGDEQRRRRILKNSRNR